MAAKFFRGDKVRNLGPAAAYLDRLADGGTSAPVVTIEHAMPDNPDEYLLSSGVIAPEGHLVLVERHPAGESAAPHRTADGELVPHTPLTAEGEGK